MHACPGEHVLACITSALTRSLLSKTALTGRDDKDADERAAFNASGQRPSTKTCTPIEPDVSVQPEPRFRGDRLQRFVGWARNAPLHP
jgi:hypothetical protein